jgi:two-component system phosphate regulon sensor histidine kinase PhoR
MIVLGVIALICLVAVQVYWVSISVNAEEETFDHNVRMSMRAVADNMCQIDGNELIADKPIDRISRNYFVARLQYNIDVSVLDSLLKHQFERRGIHQDFEYGVYNCETDRMVFGSQVSQSADGSANRITLPKLTADEYYFGVYFPNKTSGLLTNLTLWKYLTAATLLILVFFTYGLVVVLKQRRLSEIQRDFIDNVTHELKTPLATLKLSAEAIMANGTDTKVEKYASIIKQETSRLEQQIEQILASSLMDNPEKKPLIIIDLSDFFFQIQAQLSEAYTHVNLDFQFDELPKIKTNKHSLETIILNVVDNAVKYGNGMVSMLCRMTDQYVQIVIRDNGNGIPKMYHKKIFEKFFRVPTSNVHDIKGYGLGMYLVQAHLRRINGTISLRSDSSGTEFIISLPLT